MRIFLRLARYALYLGLGGALLGFLALGIAYWLISPRLPAWKLGYIHPTGIAPGR